MPPPESLRHIPEDVPDEQIGVRRTRQARSRSLLVVDDDFSWSDAPASRGHRRHRTAEAEDWGLAETDDWALAEAEDRGLAEVAGRSTRERSDRHRSLVAVDRERPAAPFDAELDAATGADTDAGAEPAPAVEPRRMASTEPPTGNPWDEPVGAPGQRRTVVITGRGAMVPSGSRRRGLEAGLPVHQRSGFKPDRVAMWAVLLGLLLLLAAATSSHAAVLAAHLAH